MLTSLIRTVVPLIVGYVLGSPAAGVLQEAGITEGHLTSLATVLVAAVYYAAARFAEEHLAPQFSWLLASTRRPVYRRDVDLAA